MKKLIFGGLFLLLSLSLFSCGAKQAAEKATAEPGKTTAKQSDTIESSPKQTKDPLADLKEQSSAEYDLLTRIAAVNELMELDREAAAEAAYEVYNDIDFASKDFTKNADETIFPFMDKAVVLLSEAGYENIGAETVTKIINRGTWVQGLKEIGPFKNLFQALAPGLVESGYFENNGGTTEEYKKMFALEDLAIFVSYYLDAEESLEGRLQAAHFVNREITPPVNERYEALLQGEFGPLWTASIPNRAWQYAFAGKMPKLTETLSPITEEDPRYLVVSRRNGSEDASDWQLDFVYQVALPAELVPEDLSELTHLIAIDHSWEFEKEYYEVNGARSTKVFSAFSKIRIYDYNSGDLVREIAIVKSTAPEEFYISGNSPENYYVDPNDREVFRAVLEAIKP